MHNILAADIGGTNSRFGHFRSDGQKSLELIESCWLSTKEYTSFSELLDSLCSTSFSLRPEDAHLCVFAVAGPVEEGIRSSPPFITWDINISSTGQELGLGKCLLINDFVAQAYACRTPVGDAAEKILEGEISAEAAAAIIGAGTGLGKAALLPDGRGGYIAMPSEGGHTNFPIVSLSELEFHDFMIERLRETYLTYNRVVSGQGLALLHEFLTGEVLLPEVLTIKLPQATATLEWFSRFYGRVCRNFALETLAMGGLYIAGGVAARSPELVRHSAFEEEFRSSDTMKAILGKIPVLLISDQNSGLWGSAFLGLQVLKRMR